MALPDDEEIIGGIVINPNSNLGKELLKWEQHTTHLIPRGKNPGNPYTFRPYPKMLYMAHKKPNGQVLCGDPSFNYTTERDILDAERFTKSCQIIVHDEEDERRKMNQGWRHTPQEAIDRLESVEQSIANASAEMHHAAKGMTANAQREWKEAGEDTHEHIVDVQPKRKRGRPAKGTRAIAGSQVSA